MVLFRCYFNYEVENSPTQWEVVWIDGEGLLSSSLTKPCDWETLILYVTGETLQMTKIRWPPLKLTRGQWKRFTSVRLWASLRLVILAMSFPVTNVRHRYVRVTRGTINRTKCKYVFKILIPNGSHSLWLLSSKGCFALRVIECSQEGIIIQMLL